MSINLEEIVERAVPMSGGHYLAVRAEDFKALVAEVERLRAQRVLSNEDFARSFDMGLAAGEKRERAAVLALLDRELEVAEAHDLLMGTLRVRQLRDIIARGEHRKEGP